MLPRIQIIQQQQQQQQQHLSASPRYIPSASQPTFSFQLQDIFSQPFQTAKMQFKTLLLTPLVAAGLAAAADQKVFTGTALRSASDIHLAPIQAAQSNLFLKLPDQKASCDAATDNFATFSLVDGELSLFAKSATPQKFYVDRSGMGQGNLGYTTGAESAPRNGERKGFAVDESGNLTFDGAGFIACPNSIDGAWSIWVSAGVENPAGNSGCLGFAFRVTDAAEPNGCVYTS